MNIFNRLPAINRLLILESAAVIFSIAYTLLITYESILCWPAAIIASLIFIYLVYKKRLLAETVLHVFYLFAAVYGWLTWGLSDEFQVSSLGVKQNVVMVVGGVLVTLLAGMLLKQFTKAQLPMIDSFTTVFSFIATFMMAHMILENWLYWMVINCVSVYLYATRGLYIAAGLYVVYFFLSINGFMQWL